MRSPVEIAHIGVEDYGAGRAIVIPGSRNRAGAIGSKFMRRFVSRRIAGPLQGMK